MTEVMSMGGLAPASRHDVISTLLNDYGTSWGNGDSSPYAVSPVRQLPPLPSFKALPPPPPKDDKLPSFMRFQLRVDEAGTKSQAQQEPTIIHSRSISRSIRPANLKLTVSNGATAALPTANITNASSASSATPPPLQNRPLPGLPDLPPPPPEKSSLRPQMGNKSSKPGDEKAEKTTSPKGGMFKRRPVPAPKAPVARKYPTLGETLSRTGWHKKQSSGTPPTDQQSTADSSTPTTMTTHASSHVQTQSDATDFSAAASNTTSQAGSQEEGSITITGDTSMETTGPPTPDLKPTLLPSPSPVPEESPSKYGLRDRTPPLTSGPSPVAKQHYRSKSSTGFDIFKASSGLQNARAYLNTITPSPTPSPTVTPTMAAMNTAAQFRDISLNEYSPRSPNTQQLQKKHSSMLSSLNDHRPAHSNAPYLNITHIDCYHNHARFHNSKNTHCPVACMLCYKEETSERWTCTWCALRICSGCRSNLDKAPNRSIRAMKDSTNPNSSSKETRRHSRSSSGPGVVLWESKMEKVRK